MQLVRDKIAELPDKRAILADTYIKEAERLAGTGNIVEASRLLTAAAQIVGNVRLRIELYRAITANRIHQEFRRFFNESVKAKEQLDALWRFHADGLSPARETILIRPVEMNFARHDLAGFIDLIRSIGVMCIVTRSGENGTIILDWNELGNRINEIGPENIPGFQAYFAEETNPAVIEKNQDTCIKVINNTLNIHYWYAKTILNGNPDLDENGPESSHDTEFSPG
jgi:hypothetical protein